MNDRQVKMAEKDNQQKIISLIHRQIAAIETLDNDIMMKAVELARFWTSYGNLVPVRNSSE